MLGSVFVAIVSIVVVGNRGFEGQIDREVFMFGDGREGYTRQTTENEMML